MTNKFSNFEVMPAPKNNQFWKQRTKHGRDKIFSSPNDVWTASIDYFEWVDKNPLYEKKAFGTGTILTLPLMRAYTLTGLLLFLDIDENTWQRYRKEKEYKDFWAVINKIDNIIYTQKFEGAAAGLLNSNIIARDLGLSEKTEHSGRDGGPFRVIMENSQNCEPMKDGEQD